MHKRIVDIENLSACVVANTADEEFARKKRIYEMREASCKSRERIRDADRNYQIGPEQFGNARSFLGAVGNDVRIKSTAPHGV